MNTASASQGDLPQSPVTPAPAPSIEGAMEQLAIKNDSEQQAAPLAPMPPHQAHPLPPRPEVPRVLPHPAFPVGDMATTCLEQLSAQQQQPMWASAYPLPPVFSQHVPPVSTDALGLVHGPLAPRPTLPMYLPPPPTFAHVPPRPHPFLPILYVSFVPSDMTSDDFDQPLARQGVHVAAIRLPPAVRPHNRAYPDAYYTWMTNNGCLQFSSLHDTEKALAILMSHAYFVTKNIVVSPLPPPNQMPLPPCPVAPRFIRPIQLVSPGTGITYPQPGQLWDFVRPWGSIREVSITLEESQPLPGAQHGEFRWRARVQFWYEEEAHRFETSYMNVGPFFGWEVEVRRDPTYIPMAPLPFQQPMGPFTPLPIGPPFVAMEPYSPPPMMTPHFSSPPMFSGAIMPSPPIVPEGPPPVPFSPMVMPMQAVQHDGSYVIPTPEMVRQRLPMMMHPEATVSSHGVITPLSPISPVPALSGPPTHRSDSSIETPHALGISYVRHPGQFVPGSGERLPPLGASLNVIPPPSPPTMPQPGRYMAPWAAQNGGAAFPASPPWASAENLPQDGQPAEHRDWNYAGNKSWKEVPGGFVSEDGSVVQHVPYRPPFSPKKGQHQSQVDFCSIIVKNLAPDVTAVFLKDNFARFGFIRNCRVMRDQAFRPRGFGFVSYNRPEDAAHALEQMNGAEIAGRRLVVAYQEHRPDPRGMTQHRGFPANRGRGNNNRRGSFRHGWVGKETEGQGSSEFATPVSPRPVPPPATIPDARPTLHGDTVSAPSRMQPHTAPSSTAQPMSFNDITLDTLADMPPAKAYAALSAGGKELLRKLNISKQPVPSNVEQSPASRKLTIISSVNKLTLHGPTAQGISLSRIVACIRDFVNGLSEVDEAALNELLHYPPIVNAMILHKLKSPRPPLAALPA